MIRSPLVLSTVILSTLLVGAHADATSDAQRPVAQHSAIGAHCARLVNEHTALAAQRTGTAAAAADHEALAVAAGQRADAHRAMLRTANFSRDPGMGAHCRNLIAQYTAETVAQRALAGPSL